MVQLLFGWNIYNAPLDAIRNFLLLIDQIIYNILAYVYNIVFQIADSEIISSDVVVDFFSRIQLVLGVIMIFKLSVSLLQYVLEPEAFNDKKRGIGQVVTRIIVMLAMLTAIIPLNIPLTKADEENKTYNYYLNNHGLLFGTLYSFQHRILTQQTIPKFIFGSKETTFTYTDENGETNTVELSQDDVGSILATYLLQAFVPINEKRTTTEETGDSNYRCKNDDTVKEDIISEAYSLPMNVTSKGLQYAYKFAKNPIKVSIQTFTNIRDILKGNNDSDADKTKIKYYYGRWLTATSPDEIMDVANVRCDSGYAFNYIPFISGIVGIVVIFLLAAMAIDIAIRSIKLVVLRLISPIAIISYIDPKSSEKGAFGNWVKLLIATYIELFLRLALIYFGTFLIVDIIFGLSLPGFSGTTGVFATVIIILAILYFIRIAPKFIMNALGLKGMMQNIGLSSIFAAAGTLVAGGNLKDAFYSAMDNTSMQAEAFNQGKASPGLGASYTQAKDNVAKTLTGDTRMTYRQMKRNKRHNQDLGLTDDYADYVHNERFAIADRAEQAKNAYNRFVKGNMTDSEIKEIEKGSDLDNYFDYLTKQDPNHPITRADYEKADSDQKKYLFTEFLEHRYQEAASNSGKWAKYDDDIQKAVKSGGTEVRFEDKYRARLNYTNLKLSDLTTAEGRKAAFKQGTYQGIRNIVGAVQNEIYDKKQTFSAATDQFFNSNPVNKQRLSNQDVDEFRKNQEEQNRNS